jgi:diguanylate cyclase (GGDEF)-like protein
LRFSLLAAGYSDGEERQMSREDRLRSHHRDRVAVERDGAAELRDRAAEERDRAADDRQPADGRFSRSEREQAARDREGAARDRAAASRDREQAAHDRKQAARDRAKAGVDGLTGALRRDRGLADLEREIDRARRTDGRLVLAFIDVDGLKARNDVHGHAAGDQLLRDVGMALRTGLRSYDLVVRYGGDEFLCVLPGTDIEGARRRLDQMARNLAERSPRASLSIGLAALKDADTLDELIARADAALYAARRGARSSWVSGATALLNAATATGHPLAVGPGPSRSFRDHILEPAPGEAGRSII